ALGTNSNSVIDNCLFYNNEAINYWGGAILTNTDCSPFFINCTFADNYALQGGGVAELELGGTATFTNCIFWDNKAGSGPNQISIWDPGISFLNVYYSDVEEGLNGITAGFQGEYLNNINCDPEFLGVGELPYTLLPTSPCFDIGTLDPMYLPQGWICPETCLCGNPRVSGSAIDLSCYEYLMTGYNDLIFDGDFSFNVYPNPINESPTFEFNLKQKGFVSITIMDMHGKVISEAFPGEFGSGKNSFIWNLGELKAGIYFCRLQVGNKTMTKKVLKLE
ncbi:MAG: T9SS type A sorting domain-containing protein, partial [Bacteroidales bacterium]|nr:T9SS type A sorting domain-containing protein [Bacteroidales bacterium]